MKWIDAIDKDYTIRRKFRKTIFFLSSNQCLFINHLLIEYATSLSNLIFYAHLLKSQL